MRVPNAKTGGGGVAVRLRPIQLQPVGGGGGVSTSGKAHFRSIEKVHGCCPDQLAFN